ncbi:hypothetical protein KP509_29G082500 [Ceratopteris richardii]|nr:hypothetical protein KP509_29G082500 [Ceratopteris richardii]
MDQQTSKSSPRHASLLYTLASSKEALMLRKVNEHKGKKAHSQFFRSEKPVRDGFFWAESPEKMCVDIRDKVVEEIPMLSFPTSHQVDQNVVNQGIIARLQCQVEQLEQRLQEKDSQILAAGNSNKHADVLKLQAKIEELHENVTAKEQEIQKVLRQLSQKQDEVSSLQCRLEKAEAGQEASKLSEVELQTELEKVQEKVLKFVAQIESICSGLNCDSTHNEHKPTFPWTAYSDFNVLHKDEGQGTVARVSKSETDVECVRRKYLACLIAARESPTEEVLWLVAELRALLRSLLMESKCNS